jgi:tetratricopeptide (TPR) repeat protein
MNLEALKEKARRHEQKEEWKKALDAYRQVILKQDKDEPPDITLYNRIGDIHTRLQSVDAAVESYEKAVDLYLEAELPNNAIAICKKVLRNLPDRSVFFLRMGQIRGMQGFLTDAKQAFLTYAERMTTSGNLDAALDALVQLVDLVPDDIEIRMGLASQLESHLRTEQAVNQYTEAYRHLVLQERFEDIEAVLAKLDELAPGTVLPDIDTIRAGAEAAVPEKSPLAGMGLGEFELGSAVQDMEPREVEFVEVSQEEEGRIEAREEADAGTGIADVFEEEEGIGEETLEPLPTLSFEDEEEALPTFGLEGSGGEGEGLPSPAVGETGGEEDSGEGLPTLEMDYEEAGEILRTFGMAEEELAEAMPAFGDGAEEGEALPGTGLEEEGGEEDESLPTFPFQEEERGEEEAEALPTFGFEGGDEGAIEEALEGALEDAAFEVGIDATVQGEVASAHREAAEAGDLDLAMELVRAEIEARPDELELFQRQVEYAFRKGDNAVLVPAYLDLAACLVRAASPAKAKSVFQQVLALSPGQADALAGLRELDGGPAGAEPAQVAHSEEYVDLGSMILGEGTEKTTRWQVAADTPSGDDQADFAKMLSQFKEKVSENVDADDVSAHHDLGTAYLEMGLLDEAIGEFQMALRSSPDHLPTHEVMGRCWMEKGQPEMAVRALNRALNANFEVEDELIGIYYIMGRAKEELGNTEDAVEFYEKVFSLDINFEDVTERLRSLR